MTPTDNQTTSGTEIVGCPMRAALVSKYMESLRWWSELKIIFPDSEAPERVACFLQVIELEARLVAHRQEDGC
jgi:hypothetical protein